MLHGDHFHHRDRDFGRNRPQTGDTFPLSNRHWHNSISRAGWHHHWNDRFVHRHYRNWYRGPWFSARRSWYSSILFGFSPWGRGWGGLPFYSGYYGYSNPYWLPQYGYGLPGCNYAQPIVLTNYQSVPYVWGSAVPSAEPAEEAGLAEFDRAIDAFRYGDYGAALSYANEAAAQRSGDPLVHEFRALVLFALGRYDEAAAGLNALLAVAPGWDWETMIGLYNNDASIYVPQLRALERYVADNPADTGARFVLAYHYLVTRSTDAAARQLEEVVREQPQDRVAARLLQSLISPDENALPEPSDGSPGQLLPSTPPATAPSEPTPAPQGTGVPSAERDESASTPAPDAPSRTADQQQPPGRTTDLVGTWVAQREDGSRFTLTIDDSSAFSWQASAGPDGSPQEPFSGNYELEGSLLVLGSPGGDVMIGRVSPISADEFHFVLVGGPPDDPGLRFKRQP